MVGLTGTSILTKMVGVLEAAFSDPLLQPLGFGYFGVSRPWYLFRKIDRASFRIKHTPEFLFSFPVAIELPHTAQDCFDIFPARPAIGSPRGFIILTELVFAIKVKYEICSLCTTNRAFFHRDCLPSLKLASFSYVHNFNRYHLYRTHSIS